MDTLYCFKFNDETGEITKIEITEYRRTVDTYTGRVHYRWDTPRINKSDSHFSVTSDKMDRFVTNKVFTLKNDYQYASQIIADTICKDINDLEKQLRRKKELLSVYMKGRNNESRNDSK